MGRHTTGAITAGEVLRIELSYLIKNKFLVKGENTINNLGWNNGSYISVWSIYDSEGPYQRLMYNVTDNNTGEKIKHDDIIKLVEVKSNLGKGKILFFICPVAGKKCRILYKCYGSPIWKSRLAYRNRIYYQSQISSKPNYFNDRYWAINKQLEQLFIKVVKSQYKGKKTRLQQRIERLESLKEYYDRMRWPIFEKYLFNY
jgi:hypothetical protein